jgi:hypothetical protein
MTYKGKPRRCLEQARVGLLDRPTADRGSQTCCIGDLKRAEEKLGEQAGGPHPDGPAREFGVVIKVVVAQCPGHKNLSAGRQSQAEREE